MQTKRTGRRVELGWEKPRRKGVVALANAVGCSKCYISQILAGNMKPGRKLARKLKRYGVAV